MTRQVSERIMILSKLSDQFKFRKLVSKEEQHERCDFHFRNFKEFQVP